MLTAKLFFGLASVPLVATILGRLSSSPPIPIYIQLTVGLCCVIFATTFLVAELWVRRPLNQKFGLVQFGFVGISVCTLAFEFEIYPLLSKPDENSPFRRSKNPHPKGCRPMPKAVFPLCPLSLILGSAARTARSGQGRAGFARRSGPLPASTVRPLVLLTGGGAETQFPLVSSELLLPLPCAVEMIFFIRSLQEGFRLEAGAAV